MTITNRKRPNPAEDIIAISEPGVQIECDMCMVDLTHSIRIKCADPVCEPGDGVDICPRCFCNGVEFAKHKNFHPYRVVELHSYPIFDEDWPADEELLLIDGLINSGLGNWQAVAEHVGTRTKEECERHYNQIYVDSPEYPLPVMDRSFDVDQDEFQARKRRRINKMNEAAIAPPPAVVVSLPGVHEVAHYLPGRLEFEVENDNEAEDLIKDLEFGLVFQYGGSDMPEDPNDADVKARVKWLEERAQAHKHVNGKTIPGYPVNGDVKSETSTPAPMTNGTTEPRDDDDELVDPPPFETEDSTAFKLALIDMYADRVRKRKESKAFVLDRGLLDIKRVKEKEKEQQPKDFVAKFKAFARLQSAEDYEAFLNGMIYELMLRKRIMNLQEWRRLGLTSPQEVERYDRERQQRIQRQAIERGYFPPDMQTKKELNERDGTPLAARPLAGRKPPQSALTLAGAPSLHLLNSAEQTLCSQLRILPRPYLAVKETLVREFARRGGRLRKKEAKEIVKIDGTKVNKIWDFLVQAGVLKLATIGVEPAPPPPPPPPLPVPLALPAPEQDLQMQFATPDAAASVNGAGLTPASSFMSF
ncbi:hypothetical protein EXIGLDRAFT_834457 [Exidia glandulosa HHB12029]|uniref:Transcriptional adapter 2 n=1 Tax=Exidia glandulosa HHB12029 TaxID=1314781 RepID=A0A165JQL3_EXIGL|nr:hypothetical protein EXIGLDRAFT_834457 [Exidia glandulosa HHB12029]